VIFHPGDIGKKIYGVWLQFPDEEIEENNSERFKKDNPGMVWGECSRKSHGDYKHNVDGKYEGKTVKKRAAVNKKSIEKNAGEPFRACDNTGIAESGEVPGDFCLLQGRMLQVMGDEERDKIDHKQEKTGGNKEQRV
jgi:hypothetical protein